MCFYFSQHLYYSLQNLSEGNLKSTGLSLEVGISASAITGFSLEAGISACAIILYMLIELCTPLILLHAFIC